MIPEARHAWEHWCGPHLNAGKFSIGSACGGCRYEMKKPRPGEVVEFLMIPTTRPWTSNTEEHQPESTMFDSDPGGFDSANTHGR